MRPCVPPAGLVGLRIPEAALVRWPGRRAFLSAEYAGRGGARVVRWRRVVSRPLALFGGCAWREACLVPAVSNANESLVVESMPSGVPGPQQAAPFMQVVQAAGPMRTMVGRWLLRRCGCTTQVHACSCSSLRVHAAVYPGTRLARAAAAVLTQTIGSAHRRYHNAGTNV